MKPLKSKDKNVEAFDTINGNGIDCDKNGKAEGPGVKSDICTLAGNVPFLLIVLANLPGVMGIYIPYMFLPVVKHTKFAPNHACDKPLSRWRPTMA